MFHTETFLLVNWRMSCLNVGTPLYHFWVRLYQMTIHHLLVIIAIMWLKGSKFHHTFNFAYFLLCYFIKNGGWNIMVTENSMASIVVGGKIDTDHE